MPRALSNSFARRDILRAATALAVPALKAGPANELPARKPFIFDVHTHFTNGVRLRYRRSEFAMRFGHDLTDNVAAYGFQNYVKEVFLDSDTDVAVIAGLPGREKLRDDDGRVLVAAERGGGLSPSWVMASRRDELNAALGGRRILAQSNCAPNHYRLPLNDKLDRVALKEQMTREVELYKTCSWQLFCHFVQGRDGQGFRLDDEDSAYFYEVARELGQTVVSVHKGYASQSLRFGELAKPTDLERAALDNPDLTFVVYNSALKHGPTEPHFSAADSFNPKTGEIAWHDELIAIKQRHPSLSNIYTELGTAFCSLAVANPEMAMHLLARSIKYFGSDHVLWGTGSIFWGSPRWCIELFQRFQISDELCEAFGYAKLTLTDREKILGLNAAKLYGLDPNEPRSPVTDDIVRSLRSGPLI